MDATRCPNCRTLVTHVDDALVSACPDCGIVIDDFDIDVRAETSAQGRQRYERFALFDDRQSAREGAHSATHGSFSLLQRTPLERKDLQIVKNDRNLSRFVTGLLRILGYPSLHDEVIRLYQQTRLVITKQSEPDTKRFKHINSLRGERLKELATAAAFLVLNRRIPDVQLELVCRTADQSVKRVANALADVERLLQLHSTNLTSFRRPTSFVDEHIRRLQEVSTSNLKNESTNGGFAFDKRDRDLLRQAQIDSPSFRELTMDMASLCDKHGLHMRTVKASSPSRARDLSLCAWAIVMHAIESSIRRQLHEETFSRVVACLEVARHHSLGDAESDLDGCGRQDESVEQDSDATAISSAQTYVKMRYMEVRRMLSEQISQVPWLSSHLRKTSSKSKKPQSSIQPLPRSDVAAHSLEVVRLLRSNTAAQDHLDQISGTEKQAWSRYWSPATLRKGEHKGKTGFEDLSQSERDSERFPLGDVRISAISKDLYATISKALQQAEMHNLPEGKLQSELAQRLGPSLTSLESLQCMTAEAVDRLLFAPDELNGILCSSQEIRQKHEVLKAHESKAESRSEQQDESPPDQREEEANDCALRSSNKRKASSEAGAVGSLTRLHEGKRTRALDNDAYVRVLNTL